MSNINDAADLNDYFDVEQAARAVALTIADQIGRSTGAFSGSEPAEITGLVDLADYIIHGEHPLDRYSEEEEPNDTDA